MLRANLPAFPHPQYNFTMHTGDTIGRIGIDCRLPTYQMGGISQYTIHLIQALSRLPDDGNRFTIFHSRREKRSFHPLDSSRFSRSDLWTPCHHLLERYSLAIELAGRGLDVFHSPDFIPPVLASVRRIITVHDLTFLHYPQFLTEESRRYYAGQVEWAVSAADHILADSEATRTDLINMLGVSPGKVTTVYLAASPVYTADYSADELASTAAELGLANGFILSVGTLEPRKNIPTLLRAYHKLRSTRETAAPLVLAGGKGWIYDEIFATIADLGLRDHVIHLSGLSDRVLAHLYRLAGVLAFPSHYEGFGLPALEAMHAGCPVVAGNRGSLPEVVGEAGLLLDPDDVDAWAEALGRVLHDKALGSRMAEAGYAQASTFSWGKTAAATMAVYRGEG